MSAAPDFDYPTGTALKLTQHRRELHMSPSKLGAGTPVRILLADDHDIVREGIKMVLKANPGWEVCGEAATGREAVEKTKALRPDIAIVDIGMPSVNGLDATRQIVEASPTTAVLILTVHESEQLVADVLAAGARGYLLKSDASQELLNAIDSVLRNKPYFTRKVADEVLDGFLHRRTASQGYRPHSLTAREREVLKLLAQGNSSKSIAAILGMSVKTAESHRANVMRKLQLHSVSELVIYALRNHIVQMVEPRNEVAAL